MTFSHLNMTANERRRQEQSTALKRFQGVQAVVTLSQLIGTVIIFYSPTYLQVRCVSTIVNRMLWEIKEF